MLEHVCEPVRVYLRTREDTQRCIVASLTDEYSNELADVRGRGRSVGGVERCGWGQVHVGKCVGRSCSPGLLHGGMAKQWLEQGHITEGVLVL